MLLASSIVKQARLAADLSQAELARRMGTTQSAVARLESAGSNPRIETVRRAVEAAGQALEVTMRPDRPPVDETMIAANLRLAPAERLRSFTAAYDSVAGVARKAAAARGT